MGIICAEHIAGAETTVLDYQNLPRAIYSQPQVASFGLTRPKRASRDWISRSGDSTSRPTARRWNGRLRRMVKILRDARYGEILGAHMVGRRSRSSCRS